MEKVTRCIFVFCYAVYFQFGNSSNNLSVILEKATVSKKIDLLLDNFRNSQDRAANLNKTIQKEVEGLKRVQLYNSELRTNMDIVLDKLNHLHKQKEKIFKSLENLKTRLTK